jgi:hypothetical protein
MPVDLAQIRKDHRNVPVDEVDPTAGAAVLLGTLTGGVNAQCHA